MAIRGPIHAVYMLRGVAVQAIRGPREHFVSGAGRHYGVDVGQAADLQTSQKKIEVG